jgi:tRNA (guanine-N7-)-methyltransferase
MRRKPNLGKRMEKCADFLIKEPTSLKGKWLDEFKFSELHIELGCGKGRFTAQTWANNPDALLIGLEKVDNVVIIAMERALEENLSNVRFICDLADDLTDFFAPGEVSAIFLNFSDPWPNRRHAKRRLTAQSFLNSYKNVLKSGGEIHMKTDNLPLFEFSLEEFKEAGFKILFESRNLHENGPSEVMTDYEMKFHDMGIKINKCVVSYEY